MDGNYYFRRLVKDAQRISPHIRFKRIKFGFYRIYYKAAYIGECHKDMPLLHHEIREKDYRLDSKQDYMEYHDTIESTGMLKNFKEGYADSLDKLRTRIYMFRHNKEFYKSAVDGYKQIRIK